MFHLHDINKISNSVEHDDHKQNVINHIQNHPTAKTLHNKLKFIRDSDVSKVTMKTRT